MIDKLPRFIELCDQQWSDERVDIIIRRSFPNGTHFVSVRINSWVCPIEFVEHELFDPHRMILSIEASMPAVIMAM